MITGSEGRTAMVTLTPAGSTLARGDDTYHIMTTPASIGELQSVQVWHDSSGKGAMESLFIDNITVWDMQTSQRFLFPCSTWLSTHKGDGRTIRTLKVAPEGEKWLSQYTLPTFSYLLYDDHLLLSVMCNSGVRHFSRAQRLVCCLTQITLWMVGSAMWYGVTAGTDDVLFLDLGVFTLRLSELLGTAATSFMVFLPVYAILVPMFRKQLPLVDQIHSGVLKTPTSLSTWRFTYTTVAWILATLTSVCSSFFVIVYSLQFGAGRSQAWLKEFFLTFLFSTFLLEPVKIFLAAYTKAVIIAPIVCSVTSCVRNVWGMKTGEKQQSPIGIIRKKNKNYGAPEPRVLPPVPKKTDHDPNWTERMTAGRNILVTLMILLIFTGNAFYIGVLDFDRHAYHVRTSLENSLLSGSDEVTTADDAWEWLSSELMSSLHPERGYSGKKLRWLDKQFPTGTNAFRIGPVRLERTTIYPDDPTDIDLELRGHGLYPELMNKQIDAVQDRLSERNCSYNGTARIFVDIVRNGSSACITTVDLPRDAGQAAAMIGLLQQNNWILMVSDTLILRANFYHPDVKLFSTMVITLQYLPGGAAYLQPNIQTFRLFQYETTDDFVQMCFHILFLFFFVYNVLREIGNIRMSGRLYFGSFWNILILCNIGLSTAVIVTFGLRYIRAAAALGDVQRVKGLGIEEFIDISSASQWDTTFKSVLSFSIFISTFCILRVLNFSRSVATVFALPRMNLVVGMLCNWLSYCQTSDDIEADTAMADYFWNSFRSLLGMRHESQDPDDEAPLPEYFMNETFQRTDAVLQEVDRVTDLMYKFECKERGSTSTDPYA
ncbi:polycystic kidney disease protein 1-like 2 isoform X2 [Branchiostoma floridae]|uniref:Polycystic kidney disease protein 1-like 2 isoform X2 n=1 Tax=Branchiostoma floridae TaxID=7739 RepID=A0A9J7L8V3_BRAFL|nr:polycystic kidney disease protein 1-like 2 isoform X2 [Branchiostoma floridae]